MGSSILNDIDKVYEALGVAEINSHREKVGEDYFTQYFVVKVSWYSLYFAEENLYLPFRIKSTPLKLVKLAGASYV